MQAFRELWQIELFRNALLAGIAVGTICSLLSVIVVLKRMAFIGEGIAHAGFGGMGTALFLGLTTGGGRRHLEGRFGRAGVLHGDGDGDRHAFAAAACRGG